MYIYIIYAYQIQKNTCYVVFVQLTASQMAKIEYILTFVMVYLSWTIRPIFLHDKLS